MSAVEFQPVWKVIKALRAHDDVLGEQLDQIRVRLGREKLHEISIET